MITPRTTPNLLDEARHLADDSYAYGAYILGRAIGRALQADGAAPRPALERAGMPALARVRTAVREYGFIADVAIDSPARRHVTLTDAAELAFT